MSGDIIKKKCAKEALRYIKNNSVIGLGGGSTISYLIQYIKESKDLQVKVVTPSFQTKMKCIENGIEVLHTGAVNQLDIAFDGCDQVDESLHALKSGGGIHTNEKLVASMARDYVLLLDETKFVKKLTYDLPVVVEVIEESLSFVTEALKKLGGRVEYRKSTAKEGIAISDHGNILLDVYFETVEDSALLETAIKQICGVIDCSLFTSVVTKALVAGEDEIKLYTR